MEALLAILILPFAVWLFVEVQRRKNLAERIPAGFDIYFAFITLTFALACLALAALTIWIGIQFIFFSTGGPSLTGGDSMSPPGNAIGTRIVALSEDRAALKPAVLGGYTVWFL